jgi:hypothetical protein
MSHFSKALAGSLDSVMLPGRANRSLLTASFALVALVAAGCGVGVSSPVAARGPAVIAVNWDGTFSPPTTQIREGDTVVFSGPVQGQFVPGFPTTFSLVHTSLGDTKVPCVRSSEPYDITHEDPELDNELTGPLRRGSSGIFALGPENATGLIEGSLESDCDRIADASGVARLAAGEHWQLERQSTTLCRKVDAHENGTTAYGTIVVTGT